eukprot:3359443-Karenia_brevis.AAC.1
MKQIQTILKETPTKSLNFSQAEIVPIPIDHSPVMEMPDKKARSSESSQNDKMPKVLQQVTLAELSTLLDKKLDPIHMHIRQLSQKLEQYREDTKSEMWEIR